MGFYDEVYNLLNTFFFAGNVVADTWQSQVLALTTFAVGLFLLLALFKLILSSLFFWVKD